MLFLVFYRMRLITYRMNYSAQELVVKSGWGVAISALSQNNVSLLFQEASHSFLPLTVHVN